MGLSVSIVGEGRSLCCHMMSHGGHMEGAAVSQVCWQDVSHSGRTGIIQDEGWCVPDTRE